MREPRDKAIKRDTARAVVIKDGKILLIERRRSGLHYYSIPGGGIEAGETAEETAVREVAEETTIVVSPTRHLYTWQDDAHEHFIYLCQYVSGQPRLDPASEEAGDSPGNMYVPVWIDIKELPDIPFGHWAPIYKQLLRDLEAGFSDTVKIITEQAED